MPPHQRTRWDDALETAEEVGELVALVRFVIRLIGAVVFLCFAYGIGVAYLVMGHTPGRLIGIGIIALAVWATRESIRVLREQASELLEGTTRDRPGAI